MCVVYFRSKWNGYFLRCDSDGIESDPRTYGGTHNFQEATRFKTIKAARELGNGYLKICGAVPETSEIVILKQV